MPIDGKVIWTCAPGSQVPQNRLAMGFVGNGIVRWTTLLGKIAVVARGRGRSILKKRNNKRGPSVSINTLIGRTA